MHGRRVAALLLLGLAGCGSGGALTRSGPTTTTTTSEPTVAVRVEGDAPFTVEVSAPRAAPVDDSHRWRIHDLVIRSHDGRVIKLSDARYTSGLPSTDRPSLLVGAHGTGWGHERQRPGAPIMQVSTADLRLIEVKPGETFTDEITLWRDLDGMSKVKTGDFVVRQPVGWCDSSDTCDPNGVHPEHEVEIVLIYHLNG